MNVAEVLSGMRRHLALILFMMVLGVAAAAALTSLQTKTYQSRATVFVSVPNTADRLDQAYQGSLFTRERVRSYADLVTTPQVTVPVIRELGLDETPAKLAARLSAEPPVDTVLLDLAATDSDPERAAAIVNAVTRQLVELVAGLEESPKVRLRVVRAGTVPAEPSSPRPLLNLALGLVLGLLGGVGGGLLKDALDTRINRPDDVAEVTDQPVLGGVPYDAGARHRPLADVADPFGLRSEAFRKLRTNLGFLGVDSPPRLIAVTSPMQGDGKSSTAMNLAFSLADNGARVVLVDADLRRPTVADTLGLVGEVGLTTVLTGRAKLADALQPAERRAAIRVLTSGPLPPNPSELLDTRQFRQVLQELAKSADYVIVDAAPLLPVADGSIVAAAVDGAMVIVRAGRTRREELRRAMESLAAVNADVLGLVVNMIPKRKRSEYSAYRYYREERPGEKRAEPGAPVDAGKAVKEKKAERPDKQESKEKPVRTG